LTPENKFFIKRIIPDHPYEGRYDQSQAIIQIREVYEQNDGCASNKNTGSVGTMICQKFLLYRYMVMVRESPEIISRECRQ
jgi:hypothetical protein